MISSKFAWHKTICSERFLSGLVLGLLAGIIVCLLLPNKIHAQWTPFKSRGGHVYNPYTQRLQGYFFPQKDPEEQEITLGPLIVRPGFAVTNTFSSNITLWNAEEQEGFYTDFFPALLFQLPHRLNNFEIEYMGDFSLYPSNSRYNEQDQFFAARAHLSLMKSFEIRVESQFGITHTAPEDIPSPPSNPNQRPQCEEQFNRRRGLDVSHSTLHLTYQKERLKTSLNYVNYMTLFHKTIDKQDNINTHNPSLRLQYRIQARTQAILGYDFSIMDQKDDLSQPGFVSSDRTEHKVVFGCESRLFKKIYARLLGTYNWLKYKDQDRSGNYWGASCHVRYALSKRLRFFFRFARLSRATFYYTGDRLEDRGALFFIDTNGAFSIVYEFRQRVVFESNLHYINNKYSDNAQEMSRTDDEYGGRLQVTYKLRHWLRIGIAGGYRQKDSNLPEESFSEAGGQMTIQCAF